MSEWTVVGVIVVLVGLVAAIVKPMLTLNTSIVQLTERLAGFGDDLKKLTDDNGKSHKRLWDKNTEQDKQLGDHETRIGILEHKKGD